MNLQHATKAQLVARFRERFQSATQYEVWRLAAFVKSLLTSEEVTLTQLRTAFTLTTTQFNALVSRIDNYNTKYYELKSTVGE